MELIAMTDDEAELLATALRLTALSARALAAAYDMAAAVTKATASAQRLAEAFVRSEAREIAGHPELAELNAQMNGFYDAE
jgi:predicted short-subunit dehydrogenase-like oxidoreductase (DUF2520 family)